MTGTRSSDAPSPVASASPAVATKASETVEATTTPTIDHAARGSSAPNRRNQRNPYTVATALPPGRELVMACEAKVMLTNGPSGAMRPPLRRSSYCTPAKQMNEANSATRAGGIHHHFRLLKTPERPDSSLLCEERAHRPSTTAPIPSRNRTNGQARRKVKPDGHARRSGEALVSTDFPWD